MKRKKKYTPKQSLKRLTNAQRNLDRNINSLAKTMKQMGYITKLPKSFRRKKRR